MGIVYNSANKIFTGENLIDVPSCSSETLPPLLYKYFSFPKSRREINKRMRQIANRRLWFSSRKLMNDPKDLMTINTDLLSEDEKNYYVQVVDEKIYFCLCQDPTNVLMWAHYANSHYGIRIDFELLKNKKPKKSLIDKEADSLIKTNEHISGINQHLCEQMKILTERMDSQEIKLQNQTNRIEILVTDNFSFKSKIKELEEQNTRLRSQIQNIINDNEIKDEEHKKVISSLERQIAELESENLSLKEENKRLQSLIDMLEKRTQ